jgi:Tol biopolymer transport system component
MHERSIRTRCVILWLGAALAGCGGGGGGGGDDDVAPDGGGTREVGGTVTGLFGTLVLQDNGGDDLTLTENGSFVFATALGDGAAYEVTVKSQAGAVCSVAQGSGTVAGADVSDVEVSCLALVAFTSTKALDGTDATNDNLTSNIWVVAADGTGLAPLTELTMVNPQAALAPAWSPDGTRLAFSSLRDLTGDDAVGSVANIWVMNADGSGQAPLTENTIASTGLLAAWSPDGTRIAYQSGQDLGGDTNGSEFNIWVLPVDGSLPPTPITHGTQSSSYEPAWSPDGSKIAFTSDRAVNGADLPNIDSNTNIWVTNSNGSGTEAVTALTNATSLVATWSPDGQHILYRSRRALAGDDAGIAATNIWLTDADGGNSQPLTSLTLSTNLNARFSPDGAQIVFESSRSLDGEDHANENLTRNIWLMAADGSGQTPLTMATANQAVSYAPAWVQ